MRQSRILLINILATGALYIGSFVVLGSSHPTVESSGQEVVDWFTQNAMRARAHAWTGVLVSVRLAIFGAQVAALLPRPNRHIFLAGALGAVVTA